MDKIISESKEIYSAAKTKKNGDEEFAVDDKTAHNARIVKIILESLTGKIVNIDVPKFNQEEENEISSDPAANDVKAVSDNKADTTEGWGYGFR